MFFSQFNRRSRLNCEPEFFESADRTTNRCRAPTRSKCRQGWPEADAPTELAGLTGQGTRSPHETAWCAATGLASSTDAAPVMTREPDWHFHQVEMDRMEQTSRRSTACRRSSRDLTTRASLFSVGVLVGSRQQLSPSLDVPWRHGIVLGRASTAARAFQRAIAVKENRHMSPDCTHVSAPYGKV